MKIAQYVRRRDPKFTAIGRIIAVQGNDVRVRWLLSGVRTTLASERLRVICAECAGQAGCFGTDQLARQRAECEVCR